MSEIRCRSPAPLCRQRPMRRSIPNGLHAEEAIERIHLALNQALASNRPPSAFSLDPPIWLALPVKDDDDTLYEENFRSDASPAMPPSRRRRLQRGRRRGIAAAGAVDEMNVIAAQRRGREAGHHRRILPVQPVADDSLGGGGLEALLERAFQILRAIEDHAQAVVIFAEIRIFDHLAHIGLRN